MNNDYPYVQIFVLSHNRKEYVVEAIQSLLRQDYPSFEVIVSDNSTDNKTRELLKEKFSELDIRFREQGIDVLAHYNLVLNEVVAPLFMICHDDDVFVSGALKEMVSAFTDLTIAAVSGNAQIINSSVLSKELYNKRLDKEEVLSLPIELARKYMQGYQYICPFPGYMYRKVVAENVKFGFDDVGKYSDVIFLLETMKFGVIKWLPTNMMNYRMHSSNDSGSLDRQALLSLTSYLKSIDGVNENEAEDYRHSILLMNAFKKRDLKGGLSSFVFYLFHPLMFNSRMIRKFKFLLGS